MESGKVEARTEVVHNIANDILKIVNEKHPNATGMELILACQEAITNKFILRLVRRGILLYTHSEISQSK